MDPTSFSQNFLQINDLLDLLNEIDDESSSTSEGSTPDHPEPGEPFLTARPDPQPDLDVMELFRCLRNLRIYGQPLIDP